MIQLLTDLLLELLDSFAYILLARFSLYLYSFPPPPPLLPIINIKINNYALLN